MTDRPRCCFSNIDKCIELIEEGIHAQCVGLENFKEDEICAGIEHTIWGRQKVKDGLCCIDRHL